MKQNKGQSLVEVVLALGVAVVVILALVRATVVSMRNANFAKNESLATKYAQEAIESVRLLRDKSDWETFTPNNCKNPPDLDTLPFPFSRTITCTGDENTRNVTVKVEWTDGIGTHETKLETKLTNWK